MKRILSVIMALLFTINLAAFPAYAQLSRDLLSDLVVLPHGEYNDKEADKMISRLSLIPAALLQGLKEQEVTIKLVNGLITDEPEFAQYKGLIPRGWENTGLTWDDVPGVSSNIVIARIGYSHKGKGHNGQNLELHETFHAIDRLVLGHISSSPEFLEIWEKEANIGFKDDGYISVYETEYFAETATLYIYSEKTRQQLKDDMPLTFEFMDKLFSSYE